ALLSDPTVRAQVISNYRDRPITDSRLLRQKQDRRLGVQGGGSLTRAVCLNLRAKQLRSGSATILVNLQPHRLLLLPKPEAHALVRAFVQPRLETSLHMPIARADDPPAVVMDEIAAAKAGQPGGHVRVFPSTHPELPASHPNAPPVHPGEAIDSQGSDRGLAHMRNDGVTRVCMSSTRHVAFPIQMRDAPNQ